MTQPILKQSIRGLIACVIGAGGVFSNVAAQTGNGFGTPSTEADKPLPKFNSRDYLFGDWLGQRQRLYESGIELNASYITMPAWNPVGGEKESATYLHNFGLSALFDLERVLDIPQTTLLVTGSQRSGESLAEEAIGSAISVQQIFGGGQTHRLVEVRMRHLLFDERLDLAYGRLSTTSDFMTSPFYCEFVTNGICGQPTAPFFNMPNGLSAYPGATWGAVARFQTRDKETYAMVGVYDGGPVNDEHGVDFEFGDNGVLLVNEIGYQPEEGLFGLPGRYSLGAFYHTGDFPHVAVDRGGDNLFISGGNPREMSGQEGAYIILEQMFHRENSQMDRGLNGFVTVVVSPDEAKSPMPYFFNTGFIYEGIFPGRPEDQVAVGMYTAWFGGDLREAQREADIPSQSTETALELNYHLQVNPYLYVRPNVQYVVTPNGRSEIDNALVLGVEVGFTF